MVMARRKNASYVLDVERVVQADGGYEVKCPVCGKWFYSTRYDATFCSTTCRSTHFRSFQQAEKRINKAQAAVYDLIAYTPRRGASKQATALVKLYRQIGSVLSVIESDPDTDNTNLSVKYANHQWRCAKCGQSFFGDVPPKKCAICEGEDTYLPQ